MPRITISIPVSLKKRLEDPRAKKSINLSRICQEALAREVQRLLDLPIEIERMNFLLARLRQERERVKDHWFADGTIAARDWVEHEAPYALLRQLGEASQTQRLHLLQRKPPPELAELLRQQRKVEGFVEKNFLEGWAHMTALLWEVIKKML